MVKQFVELRRFSGVMQVPRDQVFFAFASGALAYDCAACGSKCCRGHNYLIEPGPQTLVQLDARPFLRFFVESGPGGNLVRNSEPGCFFLRSDGFCDIHVNTGHSAKPETCRLFPFNSFKLVGETLVVAPHGSLCPLEVVAQWADESDHDRLFNEMASQGISSSVVECEPVPVARGPIIEIEKAIRESSAVCLQMGSGLIDFLVVQQQLARDALRSNAWPNMPEDCADLILAIGDAIGVEHEDLIESHPDVEQIIIGMTPYLRSRLLFAPAGATDHHGTISILQIPFVILSLYVIVLLAKRAGMARITFQTVTRLYSDYWRLIYTLSHLNTEMTLRDIPERRIALEALTSDDGVAKVAASLRRTPGATLGKVIADNNEWSGVDRVLFLKRVGNTLAADLMPSAATI